jgi:hypothetical protein
MKRSTCRRYTTLTSILSLALFTIPGTPPAAGRETAEPPTVTGTAFARPSMRFEPNLGQFDSEVLFVARGRDATIFLTGRETVLRVSPPVAVPDRRAKREPAPDAVESAVVRLRPVGADPRARAVGLDPLPGVSNYLLGDDPARWRADVPGYASVRYEGVYPGVDMVYYGNDGRLEYDFVLAPGADARRIAVEVEGADSVDVDASGDLVLRTAAGDVRQPAPVIYQEIDGARRAVAGGYALRGAREVGFALADYDPELPLVIDPEIVYSTYLGGSLGNNQFNPDHEIGWGIAAGADGSVYAVGQTASIDFPTRNPIRGEMDGSWGDAYITKLSPSGEIVYSTYFGGIDGSDSCHAVEVDSTGAVFVAGQTNSTDFPKRNPLQSTIRGGADLFLTKLGPDGKTLVYSTYFGGSQGQERCTDIAVDAEGTLFVVGDTTSTDFPLASPTQATFGGGDGDVFFSAIAPTGSELSFSTFDGEDKWDVATSVVVDPETGDVYVSGGTDENSSFGVVSGGDEPPPTNKMQKYVKQQRQFEKDVLRKLINDPSIPYAERQYYADILRFRISQGHDLHAGGAGSSRPVYEKAAGNSVGHDVNFTVFGRDLEPVKTKTLGGSSYDTVRGIAADSRGAVYLAGDTESQDFPTVGPVQANFGGGGVDGFVAVLAPDSLGLAFATYLGGAEYDQILDLTVDAAGNMYVTGFTLSTDFPTTPGAPQTGFRGRIDAFVTKISAIEAFEPDFAISAEPSSLTVTKGQQGEIAVAVDRIAGFEGRVTVTAPDTKPIKVKLTPATASTTGGSVTFKYKVKKKAQPGTHELVFAGRDASGRERTASVTMVIQ